MKEAQREVYNKESAAFAARQRPPSSSSSRRRQKEEDRQLGILHADGDSGDEFDDLERICLEEHEASKGDRRSSSRSPRSREGSRRQSPATSPRGSMFRQSLADKRRAMDSTTRTSRIVTRDDDINALLQDPNGPNLMDALQKRYEQHNKARASAHLVRKMAQAATSTTIKGTAGRKLSPRASRSSKSPTNRVSKTGNFNPTPSTTITLDQPRRNSRVVRRLRTHADSAGAALKDKPGLQLQLKSSSAHQMLHPHRRHQRSVSSGGSSGLGLASSQHYSRRLHVNPQGSRKESDSEADALLVDPMAGRSIQPNKQRAKPKRRSSHHRSKSAADGDRGSAGVGVKPRTSPVRSRIGRSNIPARSPSGSNASFLTRTASWQLKQLEQKRIRQLAERAAQEKQHEDEARDIWSGPGVQTVHEDL